MSYLPFSRYCAGYLAAKAELQPEQEDILAYVIELIVLNAANILFALLLGFLLGVFKGTAACLITIAIFRQVAGGAHSDSAWRCALISIIIFPLLALFAAFLSLHNTSFYNNLICFLAIGTGFLSVLLKAPVDSPNAPIISPLRRKRLKILSVFIMAILAAIIFYLHLSSWVKAAEIQLCLSLSILWVSFILSKPGHFFFSCVDSINFFKKDLCGKTMPGEK
ncbi:MAG TPA: accessory regulator AgrB [Desulfotomaculum sp.]|nr:MAG: putative membrane protein [Desulfotomaculum sp. 46_80]HAG09862.1 accessory regulator AgrB [Desulfotomaculum sp.]HBY03863.1 accessory regulator AgrB [Desulfotomaculum sp.]